MVELRQSKTDQTTSCMGSFLSVSFHITYRRIKSVFHGFVKFCGSNKMWKILVYIFLLTLIFGNIGYSVWQKQVGSKNTVHFKRNANRMCGSKKNPEHVPFLLKKTVTQIHLETDVKIKNELPIVVGLSQVLPKSRASLFGLFGRYWMLFILSMDNNRFVH